MYKEKNAESHLFGAICQLFLDHGLHAKYGIGLLHKHFPIKMTERLVDYHKTSSAWEIGIETASSVPKYEAFVVPRSYRFFGGEVTPYEFGFAETIHSAKEDNEFLQHLSDLLDRLDLKNVFGLRVLDDYDPNYSMEVTEGNSNIMLPRGSVPDSEVIDALWVFSPEGPQRCHCNSVCRKIDGKHVEDHGCS